MLVTRLLDTCVFLLAFCFFLLRRHLAVFVASRCDVLRATPPEDSEFLLCRKLALVQHYVCPASNDKGVLNLTTGISPYLHASWQYRMGVSVTVSIVLCVLVGVRRTTRKARHCLWLLMGFDEASAALPSRATAPAIVL